MTSRMTSAELTEWMAYYSLQADARDKSDKKDQSLSETEIKAMFAGRVIKKGK